MRTTSLALILSASLAGCVGPGDPNTSTTESNISVYQWTDDQPTGGRSGYQPGLASFGGRLHMLMTNMDLVYPPGCSTTSCAYPTHKLEWQRFNGSSWSTPVATGQLADYGPAVAVLNNRLVAVYHASGQNRLVMTTSDGTNGWSAPVNAGTTLNSTTLRYAPALAVRNGVLYAAYCTGDSAGDHIRIDEYTTAWRTVSHIDVDGTCKGVAMTLEPDGHLRMLFNNQLGSNIWSFYEARDNGAATTWVTSRLTNKYTVKPPSIAYCDGLTHMIHGGYSNGSEIWWSARENGAWIDDQKVPNQTSDNGAAVACYNGTRPIMVHNGGYDDMHWSEFVP